MPGEGAGIFVPEGRDHQNEALRVLPRVVAGEAEPLRVNAGAQLGWGGAG